jgi:hypothetical protein
MTRTSPSTTSSQTKVDVYLNMFYLSMVNRVMGELHSGHIVTVDDNGLVNIDMELLKKMA